MAVELEALKNEVAALNEKYAKMQEQKWLLSEQKKELTIETNSLREQLDYQSNKIGLCFSTKEKIDSDIRQVKNKILSQQQRLEEVKTKKNILTAECNKYSQEIKVTLVNQTNVKKQIEKEILQISDKTIEENEIRGKIFLEKDKLIREIEMIKNMIKTSNQHRNEMEQTFLADIEMMKSQINHTNLPIIAPRTKSD